MQQTSAPTPNQIALDPQWEQGAAIAPCDVAALIANAVFVDTNTAARLRSEPLEYIWFVATQTCDLHHSNLDVEPVVDLFAAKVLANPSQASFKRLKSLRKLDLVTLIENKLACISFQFVDRAFLPRQHLYGKTPDPLRGLSAEAREQWTRWLALRIRRVAFPDAFNELIKPVVKKLEKRIERSAKDIQSIRVKLRTRDGPPGGVEPRAAYSPQFLVVLDAAAFAPDETSKLCADLRVELKNVFGDTMSFRQVSSDEITVKDASDHEEINLESLSESRVTRKS